MTRELRCAAGHVVGTRLGTARVGQVALRHHGRAAIVYEHGILEIACECGATWTPDAPRLPLDDLEVKAPLAAGRR